MFVFHNGNKIDLDEVTEQVKRSILSVALVEVRCGTDHSSIYIPGKGWSCRYARGFVGIGDTGLISKRHECHLCGGCFWCLPVTTPKDQQVCSNCGGPLEITQGRSVWPDLFMATEFTDV